MALETKGGQRQSSEGDAATGEPSQLIWECTELWASQEREARSHNKQSPSPEKAIGASSHQEDTGKFGGLPRMLNTPLKPSFFRATLGSSSVTQMLS